MRKGSFKKLGVLLCALTLAIIVGCQSIAGFNLNNMILNQLDVTQQEQSQQFELEVELNEKVLSAEGAEITDIINAFRKVTLNITHSKRDDKGNQWMTGVLSFGKGDIPFTFHLDSKALRFDVGGAHRPLIVEIPDMNSLLGTDVEEGVSGANMQQAIMETVRPLLKNIASYLVKSAPNPPVLKLERVTLPVHGVTTSLTKVHAELNGEQLGELIPVFIDNLIQDKDGLRSTLHSILQWIEELPPELKQAFGDDELFAEELDSDTFVEEGYNAVLSALSDAKKEIDEARMDDEEWQEVFDKGVTMSADLFVDDSLHLRKSAVEINIAPAIFSEGDSPLKSIKIRSNSEMWNVNGNVEIPAVKIPLNALTIGELADFEPYQTLRLFDENSVVYKVLKNDFQVDDQSFELSNEWGIPFYIDSNDVTYVPLRATMDNFGVKLNAPSANGEIGFYDRATEQAIVFQTGSTKATVNSKSVTLAHKVENDGLYTYVSADDLFGLLHAQYSITEDLSGGLVIEVTRDL
ncbi:stalk domain-containing protein [Cohnella sp. WQ 127256]|uniref:stalk domain-containing protein n=1 Tax=Cohnella sp. WQ 127256 TaxID=2938790 RepID=UPI002117892C